MLPKTGNNSVKRGALNFRDGHNLAMHEFAHQLDQEDGRADGVPILEVRSAYSAWSQVFSKEYELFQHKTLKGNKTVMDKYGATDPAEFFAVATETFFEKPMQLKKKHNLLYKELQEFYKVNPIEWNWLNHKFLDFGNVLSRFKYYSIRQTVVCPQFSGKKSNNISR